MPLRSDCRSRHRLSPCYRHPEESITGICASCLRERLYCLDSAATANVASPELRRCRSVVSGARCEASTSTEQRRKSCDVVSARSSLSTLLDLDDLKSGSESELTVESKNVGLRVIESEEKIGDEIRVTGEKLGELDERLEDGEFKTIKEYIDLEFQNKVKKPKDLKEIAGNLFGAASVFTKKLQKWKQKNSKTKKINDGTNGKDLVMDTVDLELSKDAGKLGETNSQSLGRRSCDTEPRFSVISLEDPRASWDGYMIPRTIPRSAPMLSVVENENGMLGNVNQRFSVDGPMYCIVEDESCSGASGSDGYMVARSIPRLTPMLSVVENENGILGNVSQRLSVDGPMHCIVEDDSSFGASGSGQSNSDSSSSMRQSSFDRSSSVQSFGKKVMSLEDHGISPANVKLVITEKELKDWQLSSSKDVTLEKFRSLSKNAAGSCSVPAKKPIKWPRVCNLFGLKARTTDNAIDNVNDKKGKKACGHVDETSDWKFTRSNSVGSKNLCETVQPYNGRRSVDNFKMERSKSVRHSLVNLDNGIAPPFSMTPVRSLRNSKHEKLKELHSPSIAGHVLQLN